MPIQLKDKKILGWCLYDWANSAYATTVMAGFFPIFFKKYWSLGADVTQSTAMLGAANSLAGLLVAILAPILGAIADRGGYKKKFLIFFAYLGSLATASLFWVHQGEWMPAALVYVMGTIGFSLGNVFYDSLLPAVAHEKNIDYVSALGFGMGYLGGGILFAFNVWLTLDPTKFGLADASAAVRVSFCTVAIWWAMFTIPLMLFLPEPKKPQQMSKTRAIRDGLKQLSGTFRKIRHLKTVFLFLIAYWLYIDGVDTIIRMAVDYGMSIGFQSNDLIIALLITQFVGFPSAIAYGKLGEKIGAKKAIYIAIGVYIFVVLYAMQMTHKQEFYFLAITIGLVQGGIQALSRSFYSRIIPHDQAAEFYGFYNLIGKFAVILGPILIGLSGLASKNPRVGISSIIILFLVGGFLLYLTKEEKGIEEVKYLELNRETG